MSDRATMFDSFRRLPRAGQWAIAAVALIVLFVAWDELSTLSADWNRQADTLLASVDRAAGRQMRETKLLQIEDAVRGLVTLQPPRAEKVAENALYDLVANVLKSHSVSNDSFNYRGPTKLPRGTLGSILGPGQSVERISGDLRFDATPEEAMSIIATLEASEQIEAVSSVRLTTGAGPGKISVELTIESWVVTSGAPPRGGGA